MAKTIKLDDHVHKRLSKHGNIGQTFQDVIVMLLDYYDQNHKEGFDSKRK